MQKVEIALRVVQFSSEIKLVIINRTPASRSCDFVITRLISDQIALHSVQLPLLIEIDIYCIFFDTSISTKSDKTNSLFIVYTKLARRKTEIYYILNFVVVGIVWPQSNRSITHCCLYVFMLVRRIFLKMIKLLCFLKFFFSRARVFTSPKDIETWTICLL